MIHNSNIHVFLSHSDLDKQKASELKEKLSQHHIQVFLAHEDIIGGSKWMGELYDEIQNSTLFCMLISENYHQANFTEQETGIAINHGIPILPICIDKTRPYGFASQYQAIICKFPFDKISIESITQLVKKLTRDSMDVKNLILDELVKKLIKSNSFSESAYLTKIIIKNTKFSENQINQIAKAFIQNPEIYNSFVAAPSLRHILYDNFDKMDPSLKRIMIGNAL